METKQITVQEVQFVKSGTKMQSGEPYTLSKVVDTEGNKYSTFLEGLIPGEKYSFLMKSEPFKGKDGKLHQSTKIVGFDNKKYENDGVIPAREKQATPTAQGGFTAEDRMKLNAIFEYVNSKAAQEAEERTFE